MNQQVFSPHQKFKFPVQAFDLLFLTVLFAFFYSFWIGANPLFTPDEGRYSEVAREMIATGDYITPRLNGVVFLDKPILYYWLQASAIKLFGLTEGALRFWPAFMGVLCSLVTYLAGTILFNRRTGILSGIILATSPLFYGAAHYANLDLEVAALIGNSLLFFIMAMQFPIGRQRQILFYTAYGFAALAVLTKGLIGLFFPIVIVGTWIMLLNRWRDLTKMVLISGFFIFLLIALPWYVLVQKANPEFFHFFFVLQQVTRFLTKADFNNKAAFWFYIPIVLGGFFPWSVFILQSIARSIQSVWKNRQNHSVELFLLLWFLIVFVFFSIPKSKTLGYILPVFPAAALLTGHYLNTFWTNTKSKDLFFGIAAFITLCFISCAGFLIAPHVPIKKIEMAAEAASYFNIIAVTLLIAGVTTFFFWKKKNMFGLFFCMALTAGIFLVTLLASTSIVNHKTIKPLAIQLKQNLKPDDEIVAFYKYYQDLPIYLERRITIVADWDAPDIAEKDNWVRELWYGMSYQNTKDWLIKENIFWQRWNSNKRLFVFTNNDYYSALAKKTTVYKIAEFKNVVLLSNQKSS